MATQHINSFKKNRHLGKVGQIQIQDLLSKETDASAVNRV